ncbi:MAG: hypothetical protein DRG80_06990 [Deltaproteobacteria bacterium]|nr:MAG: hypothetical protein DRG80_06990 [Deltaproteobacteria bacterium]
MKVLISILFLLLPTLSWAESTISCHCFQDRTFNHRDTAAADPYFLATTQNSFISLLYGVEKSSLVKAKMSGTSGSYLWILFDVAARSQQEIDKVDKIYGQTKQWNSVFTELNLTPQQLGEKYWQLGNDPEKLADHIVDLQLNKQFGVSTNELQSWHEKGMNRKELILANLLDGDPITLFNQVNSGKQTWGKLLYDQGLLDGKAINRKLKEKMSQL